MREELRKAFVDVLPEGEDDVTSAPADAATETAVVACLEMAIIDHPRAALRITGDAPPVDLAFAVAIARPDGTARTIGTIAIPAGETRTWHFPSADLTGYASVEVILTPSAVTARTTTDVFDIWARPIRVQNVELVVEGE